jgi:hypothetical protein
MMKFAPLHVLKYAPEVMMQGRTSEAEPLRFEGTPAAR